jgi:hypothetical protein
VTKPDGGPAFPHFDQAEVYRDGMWYPTQVPVGGMSLRDWFAGQALAGGVNEFFTAGDAWGDYDDFARTIYGIADAMLRAREK